MIKHFALTSLTLLMVGSTSFSAERPIEVREYCSRVLTAGQANYLNERLDSRRFKDDEDLLQSFERGESLRNDILEGKISAWTLSQLPSLKARLDGYYTKILQVNKILGENSISSNPQLIENFLTRLKERTVQEDLLKRKWPELTIYQPNRWDREFYTQWIKEHKTKFSAKYEDTREDMAGWACRYHSFWHADDCKSAMIKILHFMDPYQESVVAPELISQVLLNSQLSESLIDAATVINRRVLDYLTKNDANRTYFSHLDLDLYQAFRRHGFNRNQASEWTWQTLGLIGTRSMNFEILISLPQSSAQIYNYVALTSIAAAANVLDHATSTTGGLYSLPKNVTTHCLYGKTYHFWETAYLAHYLKYSHEKWADQTDLIRLAPYLGEIGYQYTSHAGGREDRMAFRYSSEHPFNEKVRVDLAFSAAGAFFATSNKRLDVDQVLIDLHAERGTPSSEDREEILKEINEGPISGTSPIAAFGFISSRWEQLQIYKKWLKIFSPFTAFDTLSE